MGIRFAGAVCRHRGTTALAGAVAITAATAGWLALSGAHVQRTMASQQQALQQIERTNLGLQRRLDSARDAARETLRRAETEQTRLKARIADLERAMAALQTQQKQAAQAVPAAVTGAAAPAAVMPRAASTTPRATYAAIPRRAAPPAAPAAQRSASTAAPRAAYPTKNFTEPRWVPDFFDDEAEQLQGGRARTSTGHRS